MDKGTLRLFLITPQKCVLLVNIKNTHTVKLNYVQGLNILLSQSLQIKILVTSSNCIRV